MIEPIRRDDGVPGPAPGDPPVAEGVFGVAVAELEAALAMLTRLPVSPPSGQRTGAAAYAIVGGLVGVLGLVPLVALGTAVPPVAAILAIAVIAVASGAVHLDLRHQVATMELLVDLNERDGTTVVAVLHDLGLAGAFFPRLVLIDGGRIVADGSPADVLTDGRIRAVFGVDPTMVRLPVPTA